MFGSKASELKILFVTFLLVVLLAIPILYSILSPPLGGGFAVQSSPSQSLNRMPANRSVASVTSSVFIENDKTLGSTNFESTSMTKSIDCQSPDKLGIVDAAHLRLKLMKCGGYQALSLVNRTNGFTAQLMDVNLNQLTSDFIDLVEGENILELTVQDSKRQNIIKLLKVQRRAVASDDQ